MRDPETRSATYRTDYRSPTFLIDSVELEFDIRSQLTIVRALLFMRRNPSGDGGALTLNGADLETRSIAIDGRKLAEEEYQISGETLTFKSTPDEFQLATECAIYPSRNTALEGLYASGAFLLTQCEAEGFRKITWYLDRPDVMSAFRVRIEADRATQPVLLSNGNRVDAGELPGGRHFAVWDDPFRKPSYLFALVAGDLEFIEDRHTTAEGREVSLRIYAEKRDLDKLDWAMTSLKQAMIWDEQRFSLSYDLDIYNVVATADFNMGAMENKGLNIFNTKYVLARWDTATDGDFRAIQGVIGHEYFHNWTGNRVTCRDWFQLSLKEGLTVYRDQEFSSDRQSRAVKRIDDVRSLRAMQFAEDAGPMAHPVRPDTYLEINNFYTLTVYEKGAEVVRMYHTLLGEDGFQRGMRLYFKRYDGQAVTCDDFRLAMAEANDVDLGQFERWYGQAGTPEVSVRGIYDAAARSYTLSFTQRTPDTPGQTAKQPLHMPIRIGLIGPTGNDLPLKLAPGQGPLIGEGDVIELRDAEQSFTFVEVDEAPIPSLFRGFSAPVKLRYGYSRDELAFLMAHDTDSFNRWDASQRLATALLLELADHPNTTISPVYIQAARTTLLDRDIDPELIAQALALPDENTLAEERFRIDPQGLHDARCSLQRALGTHLKAELLATYQRHDHRGEYRVETAAVAARTLKNLCLFYLTTSEDNTLAVAQYERQANMTDVLAALSAVVRNGGAAASDLLDDFYHRWQHEQLVLDKWLAIQATSPVDDAADKVRALLQHSAFNIKNPNKVRALINSFARFNPARFHALDGSGYVLIADQVLAVDPLNPQTAARIVSAFNAWRRYDAHRQQAMRTQLERIVSTPNLSGDVYEIASKAMA